MRKLFVNIIGTGLSLSFAFAQDSLKTTTLDEVVVSASRSEQSAIEIPRSVTVINRNVIEKSVFNSVGELLAKQEGIYLVGPNQTPGTNQSLFMRGANSNQVVVMIDGKRIMDPSTPNAAVDLAELSLTSIDRIEIIRGSHSTVFGGSAIGGIVNIITKKDQLPGIHGLGGIQAGTFGNNSVSFAENVELNYTMSNGLYLNGSIINQNVSGLNATVDTVKTPGVYKTVDNDDFRKTDTYFKTGYRHGGWDLSASFKKVDQRAEIDKGAFQDDDNAYVDFNRNLVDYHAGYQVNQVWKVLLLGSWSKSTRKNENDSSKIDSNGNYDGTYVKDSFHGKILTNEVQANYQYKKLKGVIGGGHYFERMSFNTYYFSNAFGFPYEFAVNYDSIDTSAGTAYAFSQTGIDLKNFSFSAGSRFSYHSIFGRYWTFEFNPSYRFKNLLTYASLSSGFNPASLYQLYDPTQDFGAYTTRGNKNLKPEESLSIELGIKKEFSSRSYFTFSAYRTSVKNSVEYVYLWDKNTDVSELGFNDFRGDTYVNITQQVVSGLEGSGHAQLQKFYIHANISWLTGKLTFNPDDIDEQHTGGNHVQLFNYGQFITEEFNTGKLVRRPGITFSGELGFEPSNRLDVNMAYRYAGPRFDSAYDPSLGPFGALSQTKVRSYNLVDIGATWQLSKSLLLAMKIENIFNEQYFEISGFQTRGRSAYLKLVYKW